MLIRLAIAALLPLALPAGAGTIRCVIAASCSATYGCTDVDVGSVADFTLSDDGATGMLGFGGEELVLTRISEHVTGPTYMAQHEGGSRAFFTLYGDGALLASTHEIHEGGKEPWVNTGTCAKAAP